MKAWRHLLVIALATLLLSWPIAVNRNIILYPDTVAYLTGGRQAWGAAGKALHLTPPVVAAGQPSGGAGPPVAVSPSPEHRATSGRSVYYGAFAWGVREVAGLPAVGVVQAAWLALLLLLAMRRLGIAGHSRQLAVIGLLSLTTTLPFFVSTVMPDVFAGVAPLAIAMLWCFGREMARLERGAWLVSLFAAAVFHNALLLLAVAVLVVAVLASLGSPRRHAGMAAAIAATLAAGAVGAAVPEIAAARFARIELTPIPFLLARTIGDGTGAAVLREDCPTMHWATCRFVPALPLIENEFLWRTPKTQPWNDLPLDLRRTISGEQGPIVREVLQRYPLTQASRSTGNSLRQLVTFDLDEFERSDVVATLLGIAGMTPELERYRASATWQDAPSLGPAAVYWGTVYVMAALFIAVALVLRRKLLPGADRIAAVGAVLLVGIVGNAAINGTFGGVYGRYGARISWLAMFAAIVVAVHIVRSMRRRIPYMDSGHG